MSKLYIPEGYGSKLDLKQTERSIKDMKDFFQSRLSSELRLRRVTAPLFVLRGMGLNDDLNGVERPVSFPIKDMGEQVAEVVHSLAKWKRMMLADYSIEPGYGLYTDMNAIRSDEELGNIHSMYVDQWDWERAIVKEDRTVKFLKKIVTKIYECLKGVEFSVFEQHPEITPILPDEITFIYAEDLAKEHPKLSSKEREQYVAKKYGAVFLIGIGGKMSTGEGHDGRAPDYDDWSTLNEEGYHGLNGDILVWNTVLEDSFELSSMGIRVDEKALLKQLKLRDCEDRKELMFHKRLLSKELPYSIGGGIGQSRLCMFFLRKAHIGEVQASIWPETMKLDCKKAGIELM